MKLQVNDLSKRVLNLNEIEVYAEMGCKIDNSIILALIDEIRTMRYKLEGETYPDESEFAPYRDRISKIRQAYKARINKNLSKFAKK